MTNNIDCIKGGIGQCITFFWLNLINYVKNGNTEKIQKFNLEVKKLLVRVSIKWEWD